MSAITVLRIIRVLCIAWLALDLISPGPLRILLTAVDVAVITGLSAIVRARKTGADLTLTELATIMLAGREARRRYQRVMYRRAVTRTGGGVDSEPNDLPEIVI